MAFKDYGISKLHELFRGESNDRPIASIYAYETEDIDLRDGNLSSPFLIKNITWDQSGKNSKFTTEISALDAVGSVINRVALYDAVIIGSGSEWTLDESFIGSKTNQFDVQVEGEVIFRRPT